MRGAVPFLSKYVVLHLSKVFICQYLPHIHQGYSRRLTESKETSKNLFFNYIKQTENTKSVSTLNCPKEEPEDSLNAWKEADDFACFRSRNRNISGTGPSLAPFSFVSVANWGRHNSESSPILYTSSNSSADTKRKQAGRKSLLCNCEVGTEAAELQSGTSSIRRQVKEAFKSTCRLVEMKK